MFLTQRKLITQRLIPLLPYILCLLFFVAYSTLSIVRHEHYQSFGYDLGINDQVVWQYSRFHAPITSIDHIVYNSKLNVHIELIYALIAPFYWIWSNPLMLLLLQAAVVCFSGLAIYLLAKRYKLHPWLQLALLLSYLLFYGVQNALWFGVHSATFEAAFIAWFIYFLISHRNKWAIVFFLLAITGKENVAGMTFLISLVYFLITKRKAGISFAAASLLYLFFVFGIYFPYFVKGGYSFANPHGLFSQLDPRLLFNTGEKMQVYLYTLLSYGFLPLLNPFYLIPAFGNLASYFILGNSVTTAQGLFLQYRIELAPLMSWATIATIARYKRLNTKPIALYIIVSALLVQYLLHLPLSYLTKQWFWDDPPAIKTLNITIQDYLPKDASVVSQDNITPHISQRDNIYMFYPEIKNFPKDSPCGQIQCNWFSWYGNPEFLLVDTSSEWDARHLLSDRPLFLAGLQNLEKTKVITKYKQLGTTILYRVNKNPAEYK